MSPAADAVQEAHNYLVNTAFTKITCHVVGWEYTPTFSEQGHASGRGWVKWKWNNFQTDNCSCSNEDSKCSASATLAVYVLCPPAGDSKVELIIAIYILAVSSIPPPSVLVCVFLFSIIMSLTFIYTPICHCSSHMFWPAFTGKWRHWL